MTNLTSFNQTAKPFTFNCLQAMDIILKIEAQLAGQTHAIALGIKKGIADGTPAITIIGYIKDFARDNYVMARDVLGKNLLTDIINFK